MQKTEQNEPLNLSDLPNLKVFRIFKVRKLYEFAWEADSNKIKMGERETKGCGGESKSDRQNGRERGRGGTRACVRLCIWHWFFSFPLKLSFLVGPQKPHTFDWKQQKVTTCARARFHAIGKFPSIVYLVLRWGKMVSAADWAAHSHTQSVYSRQCCRGAGTMQLCFIQQKLSATHSGSLWRVQRVPFVFRWPECWQSGRTGVWWKSSTNTENMENVVSKIPFHFNHRA